MLARVNDCFIEAVVGLVVLIVECIVATVDIVDLSEVELAVAVEEFADAKICESASIEILEVGISVEVCTWLLSVSEPDADKGTTTVGNCSRFSRKGVALSWADNFTKDLTKSARYRKSEAPFCKTNILELLFFILL